MGRDKGRREYSTTLIDIDQLTDGVSQLLVPLLSLLELQINAEATATNNNSQCKILISLLLKNLIDYNKKAPLKNLGNKRKKKINPIRFKIIFK